MSWSIQIEGLGKKYRRGEVQHLSQNFRESLTHIVKSTFSPLNPFRRLNPFLTPQSDTAEFWALKDINLEVLEGEVLGIIGRNGTGKSTFLKIISRIVLPTCGTVRYRGRMASLLEVGTGFHRELTGHENIFLNGSILGMHRKEIARKFDEIVEFAGVGEFINTPVKFYSSGMYVRLAFAVAAHLDPDILVVDEVLAVGDITFQQKCLGKMGEVAKKGRTVLFVSHNLGAVSTLCHKAVLLDGGGILFNASSDETVSAYLNLVMEHGSGEVKLQKTQADAYFTRVAIQNSSGKCFASVETGSGFKIRLEYDVLRPISGLDVSFSLFDSRGSKIFYNSLSKRKNHRDQNHLPGRYVAEVDIPANFLAPGIYTLTTGLHNPHISLFDRRDNVLGFSVLETGSENYAHAGHDIGAILVQFPWNVWSE